MNTVGGCEWVGVSINEGQSWIWLINQRRPKTGTRGCEALSSRSTKALILRLYSLLIN